MQRVVPSVSLTVANNPVVVSSLQKNPYSAPVAIHGTPGLIFSTPLACGDEGTEQTISVLRNLVDDAWKDPYVNRTAIDIIRNAGVAPFDRLGQIRAIYNWVLGNFYFVSDPVSKEALRPTRDLLEMMAGDCDDINANVLPSLLGTIGYETRFVTVAADPTDPDSFSHIYVEVLLDGNWIPLDAARPGTSFGLAPANWFRREWWSVTDDGHEEYPGAGQLTYVGAPSGMSGRRMSGLGDLNVPVLVNTLAQTTNGILTSVGGNPVTNPSGYTIGPGGVLMQSASQPVAVAPSQNSQLLLAIGAGLLLWMLMK
jgi:hypothetical protein